MQQWEYLVVPLEDAGGLKKKSTGLKPELLNELGSEGWEAVGLTEEGRPRWPGQWCC